MAERINTFLWETGKGAGYFSMTKQSVIHCILILTAVSLFFPLTSCMKTKHLHVKEKGSGKFNLEKIKEEMIPLDLSRDDYSPTPSITEYFDYYGIHFEDTRHLFGTFKSDDNVLAAHVFLPDAPKGTIFLLHGYYDHTGILKNLIRSCLSQGYATTVFDLPGHGLSTGERFSINDFSEYVAVLNDFIKLCQHQLPAPFHLIGHSTGSAIAYEYLNAAQDMKFDKVIFLAPLVHNAHWYIAKTVYFIAKVFSRNLPRLHKRNSSDPHFIEFVKKDPLQRRMIVPIQFLKALYGWDKRIRGYESVPYPVLIIQGTHDVIVDWKYNINFLERKIKRLTLKFIQNANHQLVNENLFIQSEVFNCIKYYLEK